MAIGKELGMQGKVGHDQGDLLNPKAAIDPVLAAE
jgi:hypothetical protein